MAPDAYDIRAAKEAYKNISNVSSRNFSQKWIRHVLIYVIILFYLRSHLLIL